VEPRNRCQEAARARSRKIENVEEGSVTSQIASDKEAVIEHVARLEGRRFSQLTGVGHRTTA
jgi:hypothetical protein